jgi:pilus assembly protein Flp/PilA
MTTLKAALLSLLREDAGQDLIEYALIAGLIAIGSLVAMTGLSNQIGSAFLTVGNSVSSAI